MDHPNAPQVEQLKQPPHSREAEQSVLGALLIDNQAFDKVSWLRADTFYVDAHRRLWAGMGELLETGRPADLTTVGDALGPVELERVGGLAYIAALAQNVPSALNIERYAELVRDKAILRQLIQHSMATAEKAMAGTNDPREIAEEAEVAFLSVLDGGLTQDFVHIGQAATEYIDWIDAHPNGVATGLRDLDSLTGGLLPGNLCIVAGRPSMGKTALALQFSEHICAQVPGLMFSLEASRREVAGRLIEWHRHRAGRDAAMDKVFKLKLFVDESASLTPAAIRSRLRRFKRQHGVSLVVVDYLQLVRGKGDTREQEVAFISRELKAIAKEFQVPVVCLAQLNRKVEERADKRPGMGDLRESGAIEQDADLILFPFRPDYYDTTFQKSIAEAEIIVSKNRNNGRVGLAKVMFSRDLNRFGDWVPEYAMSGAA